MMVMVLMFRATVYRAMMYKPENDCGVIMEVPMPPIKVQMPPPNKLYNPVESKPISLFRQAGAL